MRILLGSTVNSVLTRWNDLLAGKTQTEQASTVELLKKHAETGEFELIMLHRLMINSAICSEIRKLSPTSKLILLSDQPDHEEGLEFLKFGIVGYANTYISARRLTEALHVIETGGVWLGQKVIQQLILETRNNEGAESVRDPESIALLSPTERIVAKHVACGKTNLEVAAELGIVERTVKAHLTAIYGKLNVGNRLSLALLINRVDSK